MYWKDNFDRFLYERNMNLNLQLATNISIRVLN